MIKLEIPVENDEDIMNMSLSREDVEHFLPQSNGDPIPDLILSATAQTRPRTYSGQSLGRESGPSSHNSPPDHTTSAGNNDTVELGASCEAHRTDIQASLSDQSVKSAIAKKRDSLRRSRQLHRTISDDGHEPLKRRRALERECELVESSLENIEFASISNDCVKKSDRNYEEEHMTVIITTTEQPTASGEDASDNDVEMQFLRTLQSGISRAMHSPLRTRKYDANCADEETWC